jgi:phage terminase large subunit-like protein
MSKTGSSTPRPSDRKLSEIARHVTYPKGIANSVWPRVVAQCAAMGVTFDEWQHGIGTLALGKLKNGKYAATVGGVTLSIPRQTGKTFLVGMMIIALCVLFPRLTVLWTAHRTRTSTMTFTTMQGMVRRKKIRVHLAADRSDGIRATNGEQEIRFKNGSRIMFGAREAGFGRGFDAVDVEVFDEAQILTEKALEDMVPAANATKQPTGALLFFMGTPPRPTDPGEEFSNRRAKALKLKSMDRVVGIGGKGVYVEFSADEDADPDDLEQVAKANPSFPHRTPIESIERMRENLTDDDSFRREGMGIWDPADTPRVIDEQSWDLICDPASMAIDRLTLAIDVAPDRSVASVALAGRRADGLWHIELDEQRKGTAWIPGWIQQRADRNRIHAIVADEMSGLVQTKNGRHFLGDTRLQITLAAADGRDMAVASGMFFDAVMQEQVRQTDQPQMNVALSVARKRPLAGGWAWNRKDAISDITPVVAATLALWGARRDNVNRSGGGRKTERRALVL